MLDKSDMTGMEYGTFEPDILMDSDGVILDFGMPVITMFSGL